MLLVTLVPGINDSLEELDQSRDQTVNRILYVCQRVVLGFPRIEWVFLGHADFDDMTKLKNVSLDKQFFWDCEHFRQGSKRNENKPKKNHGCTSGCIPNHP